LAITEQRPLSGKRIVVTRTAEQARELVRRLEQLGAEVLLLPAVTFGDPQDTAPLDQAILSLRDFDWILFTSMNAVHFFSKRCRMRGDNNGWPLLAARPLVAAVGPATATAAEEEGLRVEYVASQFRGEALAAELGARLAGKRVLLPRSDRAGSDLPAALRAGGAEVVDVIAYHTGLPRSFDRRISDAIRRGQVDVVSFFSPSAFHPVMDLVGLETLRRLAGQVVLAAVGPVTARAIRRVGLPVEIEAQEATAAALVAAICNYFVPRLSSGVKPQ
jgi:uroporphyrinogen III methyltransferase/synthase